MTGSENCKSRKWYDWVTIFISMSGKWCGWVIPFASTFSGVFLAVAISNWQSQIEENKKFDELLRVMHVDVYSALSAVGASSNKIKGISSERTVLAADYEPISMPNIYVSALKGSSISLNNFRHRTFIELISLSSEVEENIGLYNQNIRNTRSMLMAMKVNPTINIASINSELAAALQQSLTALEYALARSSFLIENEIKSRENAITDEEYIQNLSDKQFKPSEPVEINDR